jgi:hypothetical protein
MPQNNRIATLQQDANEVIPRNSAERSPRPDTGVANAPAALIVEQEK